MRIGDLVAVYVAIVLVGLALIVRRGYVAQDIDGVGRGSWPLGRPAVSYLAAGTLAVGHRLRERDLVAPDVSANLAMSLPPKDALVGKYVTGTVPRGMPVERDALSVDPPTRPAPGGMMRLRLPIDDTVLEHVNAGARVWLVRGDTLAAQAQVEDVRCRADRCAVRVLVDSAVGHVFQPGSAMPRLTVILPITGGRP